jgi:hypothetical protein
MDERDDDATAHAAAAILCWFGAISIAGSQKQASRPSASRRQRQTSAGRSGAKRWSAALKFAVSELILKDITPLLVKCSALVLPAEGARSCGVDRHAGPRSVASPEADRKKPRKFSEAVKIGLL